MPARDRSLDSTEYKIKCIPEARRNNNALHIVLETTNGKTNIFESYKIGDNNEEH